ncbi:hypothetical protein BDV11DRAFT_194702 [Aspergillus similis]
MKRKKENIYICVCVYMYMYRGDNTSAAAVYINIANGTSTAIYLKTAYYVLHHNQRRIYVHGLPFSSSFMLSFISIFSVQRRRRRWVRVLF